MRTFWAVVGGSAPLRSATGGVCTEGMTHACENITFPQLLLRAVKLARGGGGMCPLATFCDFVTTGYISNTLNR